MGYLICNKCGGYYELWEGESPDDFTSKCECGGSLNYVPNLDDHIVDKHDPVNNDNICPKCQFKNKKDAKFCYNCGNELINKTSNNKASKTTPQFKNFISILDFRAIIIGMVVVFIFFVLGHILDIVNLKLIGILIGGLISGYFSKKGFKNGIINGATVGAIFYFVYALFIVWFFYFTNPSYLNSQITGPITGPRVLIMSTISAFIIAIGGGVIGTIGGIIGNIFSKKR